MGKLTTKIRQTLCRHRKLEFVGWRYEDGKWLIYGKCRNCGIEELRGISFTDKCAEELKTLMEQEKETTDKGAGEA